MSTLTSTHSETLTPRTTASQRQRTNAREANESRECRTITPPARRAIVYPVRILTAPVGFAPDYQI